MLQGFKDFISRGNAIEMAVGIIIGGAFTPIVTAVTEKVIMPIIAALFGKPDFDKVGEFVINGSTVQPGTVITALINFLLVALALYFCIIVPMNKLAERKKKGEEPESEAPSDEVILLTEIRDSLNRR